MPLISCPDCEKRISDGAPACPNCGRPMKPAGDLNKSSTRLKSEVYELERARREAQQRIQCEEIEQSRERATQRVQGVFAWVLSLNRMDRFLMLFFLGMAIGFVLRNVYGDNRSILNGTTKQIMETYFAIWGVLSALVVALPKR